ncbi:MAG: hypothetical protein KDE59_16570, partial [Anaerolineales bacterium]|nr:hypothetical protein [Anaerolineales bacterium]
MRQPIIPRKLWLGVGLLLVISFFGAGLAAAQEDESPVVVTTGSPIHPTFPLLDAAGENVLDTGAPVSTMTTCGACHDAEFIAEHSFHADAGLSQFTTVGDVPGGQSWDSSDGPFGRWNPVLYRYLSPEGDARVDLTTAEWVQWFVRHPGGGPAVYSRDGELLTDLAVDAANVETAIVNAGGELESWDWNESGTVAMNCFLCHYPDPNNDARITALAAGDFDGANTATLVGTGLVEAADDGWAWNAEAFSEDGNLKREYILVQDPTTANCGECHGITHTDLNTPFTLEAYTLSDYNTMTTGQVMSPQRISDSGLNLANKEELNRSWDIHIERVFDCSNCHYSLNNPIYFQEAAAEQPDHLAFDPRRMDLGDYIYRPLHEFAKGQSAQSVQAPGLDNTLRRCESCHTLEENHEWLPYKDRHTEVLACESCHIPELYAPALQYVDWTVLGSDGEPVRAYRGLEGNELNANAFITGYEPVLLPRENSDGDATLAPFNLVTTWYWVYGTVDRPVPLRDLQAAWLTEDGSYHPDILAALDADGDGDLSQAELVLEDEAAIALISGRLADLGLENPRIAGEVLPYSINHNVAKGEFATRECRTCHADESQINQPFDLADRQPGNVTPTLAESTGISWSGGVAATDEGTLQFQS